MLQPISYRDKDGFVLVEDARVRRYVNNTYAEHYEQFIQSGLYQRLINESLLIPHQEESEPNPSGDFYKILEPEYIPFISYPYEWTISQWKEMAILTLQINKIAMEYGMILKDASPFNITFVKGRPIFFDTLSFEKYQEASPWIAYRQFCESILAPIALMCFNDTDWGKMMISNLNGWNLKFISKNLPLKTWFKSSTLLHIHLHALSNNKRKEVENNHGMSKEKLTLLWTMMESSIKDWKIKKDSKIWGNYYDETISSNEYLKNKTALFTSWMQEIKPIQVIDLGANSGHFSKIAAAYSQSVIAVESDMDCLEQLRSDLKISGIKNIETVLADLVQPSPAIGWANQERSSLLNRLQSDTLMALALIHHLCIGNNVPFQLLAAQFAILTNKYAIVEFVPTTDNRVKELLANRKDIFTDYNETHFEECFEKYFQLIKIEVCVPTNRKLYLWEKI